MKTLLVAASSVALFASSTAVAAVVLEMDLSVVDEVTITATGGLASATASFSDTTGVLLADANSIVGTDPGDTLVAGDITTGANTSDGSPLIFVGSTSFGLNVWTYTADATSDITAGSAAFTGSATWTISSAAYASLLAGPGTGTVYAGADTDDDIAGATAVGEWNTVVPEPGSLALLGLGGLALLRRRR